MNEPVAPQTDRWPASDPGARKAVAATVARAFSWSPAIGALASMATTLAAVELAVLAWVGVGSAWLILAALVLGYPLTVLSFYISPRYVIRDPAKTWWQLKDHRGKAVVLTKQRGNLSNIYYLAAWPRGKGLGYDLIQHVTSQVDAPLMGSAWPSTARIYESWGAINHGRRPGRLTHYVEFRPPEVAGPRQTGGVTSPGPLQS